MGWTSWGLGLAQGSHLGQPKAVAPTSVRVSVTGRVRLPGASVLYVVRTNGAEKRVIGARAAPRSTSSSWANMTEGAVDGRVRMSPSIPMKTSREVEPDDTEA